MDKYEDLGLEASKFIEDLNMYEASRDGLFRMRRDAGNNPDFEETRRVFASKMTKIHMQKHQEEMAKTNQAIKLNGGHSGAYHAKDRPPINSYRQPGEAAAKPPILSGPVSGTAGGSPHAPFDGHKHHTSVQPELPAGKPYGYGNSYDNKETHSCQRNTPPPPNSPGSAPLSAPTHARHPVSQPAAWAPCRENQCSSSISDSERSTSSQQLLPLAPPITTSLPPKQNQAAAPSVNQTSPSSAWGWTAGELSGSAKPDLISALPLSAFTGGTEFHGHHQQQQQQKQQPSTQPTAQYPPPSPTLIPTSSHNGLTPSPPVQPTPPESPQPKAQVASAVLNHGSVSKNSGQGQGQSQTPSYGQTSAEPEFLLCSPKSVQLPCQSLLAQPADQGPTSAEIKLEALTKRLEKEMDAHPKADYFGKTFYTITTNKEASVSQLPAARLCE